MSSSVPSEQDYARAVQLLESGEVIGLPTETVYGLAGDATNPRALARIYELKRRPQDHPLIVHLGDASWLPTYAKEIPDIAVRLAQRFWPGPLTLILERAPRVPLEATGGLETVALRVPAHPVASAVLSRLGRPLAAPSANLFGRVSPTRVSHVRSDFGAKVPLVLDGGVCEVGVESTILDVRNEPRLLRPGGLSRAEIEAYLGVTIATRDSAAPEAVRAPGTLASHYAPRAPLLIMTQTELFARRRTLRVEPGRLGIFAPGLREEEFERLGPLEPSGPDGDPSGLSVHRGSVAVAGGALPVTVLTTDGSEAAVARTLYDALRRLDEDGCRAIWAIIPASGTLGEAVDDRLMRAAAPRDET